MQQHFDRFSAAPNEAPAPPRVVDGRVRGLALEAVGAVRPALVFDGKALAVDGRRFERCRSPEPG